MKNTIASIVAASLLAFTIATIRAQSPTPTPPAAQVLPMPVQRIMLAPIIKSPSDALVEIQTIAAAGNAVSVSGSTVYVFPPSGMLITTGSQAGMVRISLMATGR